MLMADLVLAEDEVTPVMSSLESNGVQVTALHNHVLHESPSGHVYAHRRTRRRRETGNCRQGSYGPYKSSRSKAGGERTAGYWY